VPASLRRRGSDRPPPDRDGRCRPSAAPATPRPLPRAVSYGRSASRRAGGPAGSSAIRSCAPRREPRAASPAARVEASSSSTGTSFLPGSSSGGPRRHSQRYRRLGRGEISGRGPVGRALSATASVVSPPDPGRPFGKSRLRRPDGGSDECPRKASYHGRSRMQPGRSAATTTRCPRQRQTSRPMASGGASEHT